MSGCLLEYAIIFTRVKDFGAAIALLWGYLYLLVAELTDTSTPSKRASFVHFCKIWFQALRSAKLNYFPNNNIPKSWPVNNYNIEVWYHRYCCLVCSIIILLFGGSVDQWESRKGFSGAWSGSTNLFTNVYSAGKSKSFPWWIKPRSRVFCYAVCRV